MSIADLIYERTKTLPEPLAQEVLDFVGFLQERHDRAAWRDLVRSQSGSMKQVWDNAEDEVWDHA